MQNLLASSNSYRNFFKVKKETKENPVKSQKNTYQIVPKITEDFQVS